MTPAERRRRKLERAGIIGADRRNFREGILWRGEWISPDEMHEAAAQRLSWFDAQMKSVRNYINRNGRMPDGALRNRMKET